MPEYRIHDEGSALSIELTDIKHKQGELLQAFGEYQSGQCSCPTDQYEKVAAMQIEPGKQQTTIHLDAVEGQQFDTDAIAACLEYTIAQTAKSAN